MITTAPARIDLAGGTLDVPPLCFMVEPAVTVNLAIDLRTSVSLVPDDRHWVIVNQGPGFAAHEEPLFQKALDYFELSRPVRIEVSSDIPRASGLGGSSTLLVALCQALFQFRYHRSPDPVQLLDLVTVLEHRLLAKPAGTQDAVAAIFGGLSHIDFQSGRPIRQALVCPPFLQGTLHLCYSQVQHHSGINNWAIIKAACEHDRNTLDVLQALGQNASAMAEALADGDQAGFETTLFREADLRHSLAHGILPQPMADFANSLDANTISKICGAGGGGCMLVYGSTESAILREKARPFGLDILEVTADLQGCREGGHDSV